MATSTFSTLPSHDPWTNPSHRVLDDLRRVLDFDQLLLACPGLPAPQLDELLLAHGWAKDDLVHWFGHVAAQDPLFQATLRHGEIRGEPGAAQAASLLVPPQAHAVSLALADSFEGNRWWWLLATRGDHAFSPGEQRFLGLWLRHWMTRFAQPQEAPLQQWLVGHDQRIILADLQTQACRAHQPGLSGDWLEHLPTILEQRYPHVEDHAPHDLVLSLDHQPIWVVLRRSRAIEDARAVHWHLELRPLEADDMPAIGLLKDDRIARALAYIHEHFAQSPSLPEIARTVHISPFHFHRLFTRQIGLSPKIYLQRKQLQVAKWLLRKGGIPIGQIAKRAGFSSHGHFTSTFHRVVGHSPSDYRDLEPG